VNTLSNLFSASKIQFWKQTLWFFYSNICVGSPLQNFLVLRAVGDEPPLQWIFGEKSHCKFVKKNCSVDLRCHNLIMVIHVMSFDFIFFNMTIILDLTCKKRIERHQIMFKILITSWSNTITFQLIYDSFVLSFPVWSITRLV